MSTPTEIIHGLKCVRDDVEKMSFALGLHVAGGVYGPRHEVEQMAWRAKAWIDDAINALGDLEKPETI